MKTIKNIATRTLIVIVTFIALSMITNTTVTAAPKPQEDALGADCGVSDADIVKYLGEFGYTVVRIAPVSGCCDALAYTSDCRTIRVFISNGIISGHEDIGL